MPKAGYLTPSSFADLMTCGRKKEEFGKNALAVVEQLALDLIGVERIEPDNSPASCEWGKEQEWLARQTYEMRTLRSVETAEFTVSKEYPFIGGICDGLVGDRGGIEIKSPYSSREHLANLMYGKQIDHYKYQIQGYMHIYERDWFDFVSFDPRFPYPVDLYIKKIYRDDGLIKAITDRCKLAYQMALEQVETIKRGLQSA